MPIMLICTVLPVQARMMLRACGSGADEFQSGVARGGCGSYQEIILYRYIFSLGR